MRNHAILGKPNKYFWLVNLENLRLAIVGRDYCVFLPTTKSEMSVNHVSQTEI